MKKRIAIIFFSFICNTLYAATPETETPNEKEAFQRFLQNVSDIHCAQETHEKASKNCGKINSLFNPNDLLIRAYAARDRITALFGLPPTPDQVCGIGNLVQLRTGDLLRENVDMGNFEERDRFRFGYFFTLQEIIYVFCENSTTPFREELVETNGDESKEEKLRTYIRTIYKINEIYLINSRTVSGQLNRILSNLCPNDDQNSSYVRLIAMKLYNYSKTDPAVSGLFEKIRNLVTQAIQDNIPEDQQVDFMLQSPEISFDRIPEEIWLSLINQYKRTAFCAREIAQNCEFLARKTTGLIWDSRAKKFRCLQPRTTAPAMESLFSLPDDKSTTKKLARKNAKKSATKPAPKTPPSAVEPKAKDTPRAPVVSAASTEKTLTPAERNRQKQLAEAAAKKEAARLAREAAAQQKAEEQARQQRIKALAKMMLEEQARAAQQAPTTNRLPVGKKQRNGTQGNNPATQPATLTQPPAPTSPPAVAAQAVVPTQVAPIAEREEPVNAAAVAETQPTQQTFFRRHNPYGFNVLSPTGF